MTSSSKMIGTMLMFAPQFEEASGLTTKTCFGSPASAVGLHAAPALLKLDFPGPQRRSRSG